MQGVTCDGTGFHETGGSGPGHQGWQRGANDFLRSVKYPLPSLPNLGSALYLPHTLEVVIEGQQHLLVHVILSQDMKEVQPLLGLLCQGVCVVDPGEVGGNVGSQKPEGGDGFHLY